MSWSTVGDERVSDGCIANAAVGWIPVDQLFPSGHQHPTPVPRVSVRHPVQRGGRQHGPERWGECDRQHEGVFVADIVPLIEAKTDDKGTIPIKHHRPWVGLIGLLLPRGPAAGGQRQSLRGRDPRCFGTTRAKPMKRTGPERDLPRPPPGS